MSEERNAPNTIEQLAINNMVNIETMLECLIEAGVIKEDKFAEMKSTIEKRIIEAQQKVASESDSE